MKINEHSLSNGAKIVGVNIPGAKSVAIFFGFRTGSRSETPGLEGMAHFLEHMMFKGSQKRPTPMAISQEFDQIGAAVNAVTSKEYTHYHIRTIPEYFDRALDVIGDMVTKPILSQSELEKEVGTVIQEIHMGNDNPSIKIFTHMEEVLFGSGTAMGHHILGTKKSVRAINSRLMKIFFEKYYVGSNAVCVIAGNLPSDYLVKASRYLKRLPGGKRNEWAPIKYSPRSLLLKNKETDQATAGFVLPGYSYMDSKRYTLEVISTILGGVGMMSSRLFNEIREKRGWAYQIWCYNSPDSDSGHLGIFGGFKKEKMEDVLKLVRREITQFADTVTAEELDRAKGYLKGTSVLRFEEVSEVASYIVIGYLLSGKVSSPENEIREYEKVGLKEIREIAAEVCRAENIHLSLIGPYKNKDKFAKILAQQKE